MKIPVLHSACLAAGLALGLGLLASAPAFAGGDVDYGNGVVLRGTQAAVPVPAPVPVPDIGGFYVRADAAWSFNNVSHYSDSQPYLNSTRDEDGLSQYGRFGVGVGYHFSRWFRGDITFDGSTSTRSSQSSSVSYTIPDNLPGGLPINMRNSTSDGFRTKNYTALANGYLDLPVTSGFTPYWPESPKAPGTGFSA